jgi:hypothetical protein
MKCYVANYGPLSAQIHIGSTLSSKGLHKLADKLPGGFANYVQGVYDDPKKVCSKPNLAVEHAG